MRAYDELIMVKPICYSLMGVVVILTIFTCVENCHCQPYTNLTFEPADFIARCIAYYSTKRFDLLTQGVLHRKCTNDEEFLHAWAELYSVHDDSLIGKYCTLSSMWWCWAKCIFTSLGIIGIIYVFVLLINWNNSITSKNKNKRRDGLSMSTGRKSS